MAGTIVADKWQNGDGTENYKCRAWVNFNGTGTVAIRASGNVSSITDNGVGMYRVNFTNAMIDANYSVTARCSNDSVSASFVDFNQSGNGGIDTTTSCNIEVIQVSTGSVADRQYIYCTIFR